ncbi:outer dynein arm-docking complex subunit 3-like [Clytia hemisphaerica]|uniref:ODAD1 central coiled coil region domain-containing protein n=1 Tax=Clytia hemisphaerica TaxID=252671 RepID=A0A7M6DR75_9CNID
MGEIIGITVTEEIEEYRRKIALLDGDRKAYYENSQWTMQMNKDAVQKLRSKNKELRLALAKKKAGDEKVIDEAFQERDPIRHCAMRGMSGKEAIAKLDQQVCESKKRLNAMRHQFKMKEKKLSALQTEFDQMTKDSETISLADTGDSDESRQLRILENRLDKMNLKLNEAKKIKSTYDQILEHQKEERRSWPKQLDSLEQGIKQQNDELSDLKVMYNDAQIARDTARAELSKLEQSVYEAKREREVQLMEYKKQAEEKKEHAEKVEKRLQRASLQQDELSHDQKTQISGEEQERKINTYEEAMSKIKDATGVSDIQEVVQRFLSQGDTQKHLEQLKVTNEKTLVRLKEDKEKLQKEFESMKYSGEAKMSSGQRLLEEYEDKLKASEQKCRESKTRQESTSRILVDIKAGVEHLADKLQHLKPPKGQVPQTHVNPSTEEYILDLLGISEQKLLKLMDELGGKDIQDIVKEMEDTDFRTTLESKLPAYNTRVKLPTVNERITGFEEDDDSGDDDDYLSRNAIKRTSQQIVDSKTKKNKPRQKKNKKK